MVYFSCKHNLYGLKIEELVSPVGLSVDMNDYHLGSVANLTILRNRIQVHREAFKKTNAEMSVAYHGVQVNTHHSMWAFMINKGYNGVMVDLREAHPRKNPLRD
ncbi:hypothetical protein AaE_014011 [Aphanomyces astaci]|uniref:Uncharacterized protein n=1 Tax=Aphanomyces astaci TaxID=112090 RepID=A0A6A4Z8P5_APHAT|nr:hypothetical protein AaE_014011 [Aphanomyces astaci]